MVELQQLWVQEAVDSMVKCLERENIQKMQGLMFWCSTGCCEDSQHCHASLAQAQALVTSELEKFQDCLARCTLYVGSKELQVERRLETCVTKCVDDHVNLIATLTRKMKESLSAIGK
ncbi:hypothetical protein FD754_002318 [Muntiacus muntjak]|uniref:Protein FAM136A n=1 Tax=Muntiacus muntjak TaxID=9888 RepID=A0A5N3W926_MUNMU|nr:hypothetical protein FD754_002318 [Muntiacus muntjak]